MSRESYTIAGLELSAESGKSCIVPALQTYKIRLSRSGQNQALLHRMYASRGYSMETTISHAPDASTIVAQVGENALGTLSVNFKSEALSAAQLYPEIISRLHAEGRRLCEFGRFAVDPNVRSKRVLGAMFHIAMLIACRLRGASDIVIEVNPRHVGFYHRALGFSIIGEERLCQRVNAPAVLLHIPIAYAQQQIQRFGGRPDLAAKERSFYPYFFSPVDEAGILNRLQQLD